MSKIRLETPDLRLTVIEDEGQGVADYFDMRTKDSRTTRRSWEAWEAFARAILAVRGQMP